VNWTRIWAVARRDLLAVRRSRSVLGPIVIVPLIVLMALPAGVGFAANHMDPENAELQNILTLLERMPEWLNAEVAHLSLKGKFLFVVLGQLMAPMFLLIPLMVSSVVAADSIAGERERKTLEPLLYAPISERELFAGKVVSALFLAQTTAVVGFVLYGTVVNAVAWPHLERLMLPNVTWLVLVFWVVPALSTLALAFMVIISARARGFQETYQLSGVLVAPILFLVFGQITGVMLFSPWVAFALGAAVWAVDGILLRVGARAFSRIRLLRPS
jgi:ABC-type Na+ efflux pump permease subunit